MLSKRRILTELAVGTNRTATALFSEEQLDEFASFYEDKWDEGVSTDVVAESFVDFFWDDEKPCRRCSVCGKLSSVLVIIPNRKENITAATNVCALSLPPKNGKKNVISTNNRESPNGSH